MDPVIKYDPKADILAMKIREGTTKDEKLLDNEVSPRSDERGELVALEVWDPRRGG